MNLSVGRISRAFCFSLVTLGFFTLASCNRGSDGKSTRTTVDGGQTKATAKEDILVGELSVVVDEATLSMVKEQEAVFLSSYTNAKLNLIAKPEVLAVKEMLSDKASVAILARKLNDEEEAYFKSRGIKARIFPVWTDAVAVVSSSSSPDTTVTIEQLTAIMKGENVRGKKLVFDNLNSSHFRLLKDLGGLEKVAASYVVGKNNMEEVVSAIEEDPNSLGILGYKEYLNFISSQPNKNNIRILSVQNTVGESADGLFYRPNQSTIAALEYPLRHTFYVLNYQPNLGLGIGFSAFITGDRGQRIVLKSGIVPATMPGREIIIRDEI